MLTGFSSVLIPSNSILWHSELWFLSSQLSLNLYSIPKHVNTHNYVDSHGILKFTTKLAFASMALWIGMH